MYQSKWTASLLTHQLITRYPSEIFFVNRRDRVFLKWVKSFFFIHSCHYGHFCLHLVIILKIWMYTKRISPGRFIYYYKYFIHLYNIQSTMSVECRDMTTVIFWALYIIIIFLLRTFYMYLIKRVCKQRTEIHNYVEYFQ